MTDPVSRRAQIGVVIPAYQAGRFLDATLESLVHQTFPDWRCVVVDDGSTDDTASIASRWSRSDPRIDTRRQPNRGVVAARHAGLAELAGEVEYVTFLDSDDVLTPNAYERLVGALLSRPDAVGASGLADYIAANGEPVRDGEHSSMQRARVEPHGWRGRPLEPGEDTTFASLTIENRLWPAAVVLLRTRSLIAAGGYDEAMVPAEDWEMLLRLSRLGPLVWVDEQVAWYRRHDANATLSTARALHAHAAIRRKVWSLPYLTVEQRRTLADGWRTKLLWEGRESAWLALANLRIRRIRGFLAALTCAVVAAAQLLCFRPVVPPLVMFKAVARLHSVARESRTGVSGGAGSC